MKTRALLNRIFWDPKLKGRKEDFSLTFIHRGAPGDKKTIRLDQLAKVLSAYFIYKDESGEEVQIPFHRILNIRNDKRGKDLYRKENHTEEEEFYKDLPPGIIPE